MTVTMTVTLSVTVTVTVAMAEKILGTKKLSMVEYYGREVHCHRVEDCHGHCESWGGSL